MNRHFDPLQYARQLEAVGVPKSQAEVHATTLMQVLDNYAQVDELKQEVTAAVSAAEARLRAEIGGSEARLEAKIEGVETRLKAEIQVLRVEMKRLRFANGVSIALAIAILAQGYFR